MSFVTDTWRQLVRRRLWPVALLLLAALAAVPILLAKDPEPTAVSAAPSGAAGNTTLAEDTGEPIVSIASTEADGARRRRVLGASKNPFEPAPAQKKKKSATVAAVTTPTGEATATPTSGGGDTSGGSTSPEGGATVPAPTATPAPQKKTYPLYTLTVRFGDSSSDVLERRKVTRLEALPDADNPALVYLGVKEGGKAAVFMLDSSVTPQGDGTCEPSPEQCETLVLREGETEFFDVAGAEGSEGGQFQLDLLDITTRHSSNVRTTKSTVANASVGGAMRYRYNARKGTLRRLGLKTAKSGSANAESALVGGR
jgi:hypothetical protein